MKNHLNIWIIKTGEPLPFDASVRPMRAAALGQTLAARGHSVSYWTSTFLHRSKSYLNWKQIPQHLPGGVTLKWLHGPPYSRNISLGRVLNHRQEAREFYRLARGEARPDIIICSLPTLDLVTAATKFGAESDIPVIIDVRDMWPEVFVLVAPVPLRPMVRVLLTPIRNALRKAISTATGVVGVSEGFVKYALSIGRRPLSLRDAIFHSSQVVTPLSEAQRASAEAFWRVRGVGVAGGPRIACYAGALSRRACQELLRAVRLFTTDPSLSARWRLVICGAGELEQELRSAAGDNVDVVGWVGRAEAEVLMELSDVGIIAYPNETDFLSTCPNKVADYLAAGLPILTFLQGEVGRIVREWDCGWVYESDGDFMAALREIEAQPDCHRIRRTNAKAVFERHFNAERVYSDYADHVERLAARDGGT